MAGAFHATRTASAHQIHLTFLVVLQALTMYGFSVEYISMDGASTNRSSTKMLSLEIQSHQNIRRSTSSTGTRIS